MRFIADLHIHSHFSRATSKNLNLEHLYRWAQLKGVQVVGTGDIAHPGWLEEMKSKLEPAEEGLFRLKKEYVHAIQEEVFKACQGTVRFMLAGEISNIYKKNDKVRKIHNVVFMPSFEAVEKFQARLEKIGNIRSDGRPILGLDARDLLEIVLETDPQAYLIPAHIWTPWFSLLGSKSGFDSVEECFEDLTPHIFALETGLSSDPPMNWRLSALDRYTLVSNSDAHSPQKLAREANVFNTELSYPAIFKALKTGDPVKFLGTIEFFPEEGKYHYDGHRKCGICWSPKTTLQNRGICPECGKPVTVGVMHRVETLADREEGKKPERWHPFRSLIPLPEVIAEALGMSEGSRRVQEMFEMLLNQLGSELEILQDIPLEEIRQKAGSLIAEGIRRMRCGEVFVKAGFDGEYGVVRIFEEHEREGFTTQLGFFTEEMPSSALQSLTNILPIAPVPSSEYPYRATMPLLHELVNGTVVRDKDLKPEKESVANPSASGSPILSKLNEQQIEAVRYMDSSLIIVAGPGTGKTRTLTHRIAYLIHEKGVLPENILALTFTNKAASEMQERLVQLLDHRLCQEVMVKTFHALAAWILREEYEALKLPANFIICNEQDRHLILKNIRPDLSEAQIKSYLEAISKAKSYGWETREKITFLQIIETDLPDFKQIFDAFNKSLTRYGLLDFDDLILSVIQLFNQNKKILEKYQKRFCWIFVDEYQDINLAQYQLLKLLVTPETNLCVIGDPDQAIYGFRGASREFFLRFHEDFPDAKKFQLTRNYRSTNMIVEASSQVITKGRESQRLNLWSEVVSNTKLEIYFAPTEKAEAEYVVHQIERLIGGTSYFSLDSGRAENDPLVSGISFADIAILFRISALARPLEEALQRAGIPYQMVGETPLFQRKELRPVMSFLRFLHNPNSDYYLIQLLSSVANISSQVLAEFSIQAGENKSTLLEFLNEKLKQKELKVAGQEFFAQIMQMLQDLVHEIGNHKIIDLIELFYDKFYRESTEVKSKPVQTLKNLARTFATNLSGFLEHTALQTGADDYDPRADHVSLLTLHACKGLEFPIVFIIGCEEKLIPYERAGQVSNPEEERRLFYVGMTRAQHKLILTHTKTRFLFGQRLLSKPSRFLNDIEEALKEFNRATAVKNRKKLLMKEQMSLF